MQLALLSLGIDTMLRAGDLLKLLVSGVLKHKGQVKDEPLTQNIENPFTTYG